MFHISSHESKLFTYEIPRISLDALFHTKPFSDARFISGFDPAPDAKPDEGGTLRQLQLRNVGPAEKLDFSPADRLFNYCTQGDNGLGKTFLLENARGGA